MSEQDARSAVGPGYQFFQQNVSSLPNLKYVFAANGTEASGYSFAIIDGKVEAFGFAKHFAEGSYPLGTNLYESIRSKLWAPYDPVNHIWISTSDGHYLSQAVSQDRVLGTSCRATWTDTGLLRNDIHADPKVVNVLKMLNEPSIEGSDPKCGIFVQYSPTGYFANQSLVMSTILRVQNIAAFSRLAREAALKKEDQKNSQTKQANQVKSPF